MRKNISMLVGYVVVSLVVGIFSGCGGGGGGGDSAPATAVGKFVDGPLAGLGYSSGTHSGLTGSDGSFTYEVGKNVKFFVGDIVVGEAPAMATITPIHLVPGSDAATKKVLNIVRFLMTIGTVDLLTGKITIPATVIAAAKGKTVDFETVTDEALLALVQVLTQNPDATLVDVSEAKSHLEKSIWKEYGGLYTGTFAGPSPSREWELTISADGTVAGMGKNPDGEAISGQMTSGILFNGIATGDCVLTGTLNLATGAFSGTWSYPLKEGQNGTFVGHLK